MEKVVLPSYKRRGAHAHKHLATKTQIRGTNHASQIRVSQIQYEDESALKKGRLVLKYFQNRGECSVYMREITNINMCARQKSEVTRSEHGIKTVRELDCKLRGNFHI